MTYNDLVLEIQKAGKQGVSMPEAEKLAGVALFVMNDLSIKLAEADRDRRMRKQGVKAIKSAIRIDEIKKHDKKPTEGYLDDIVNLNSLVTDEEKSFDSAEVNTDELTRQFNITKESHIYFRGISKGKFE